MNEEEAKEAKKTAWIAFAAQGWTVECGPRGVAIAVTNKAQAQSVLMWNKDYWDIKNCYNNPTTHSRQTLEDFINSFKSAQPQLDIVTQQRSESTQLLADQKLVNVERDKERLSATSAVIRTAPAPVRDIESGESLVRLPLVQLLN